MPACAAGRWLAHTRGSGDRVALAAYLGGSDAFDQAIGEFSEAYANQNARDFATFGEAARTDRSRRSPGSSQLAADHQSRWSITEGEAMTTKAKTSSPQESIKGLAQGDPKVLETLTQMTMGTLERSGLDDQTYMLVRMAALVATDAAPVSYLVNMGMAAEAGVDLDRVVGTMVAVAPVVGSARIASAAAKMVRAGVLGEELAATVGAGVD